MMHLVLKVGLIVVFSTTCLAENFSFCKVNSPDGDKCLAKNIETALHSLKDGIPEYGLKQIDPLPVAKIRFDAGSSAVQLVQNYDNLEVFGWSTVKIKNVHYGDSKKALTFTASFPKIIQQGHYIVDGAILSLPVKGDGQSKLELENVDIEVIIQFQETQKDGQKYFKIKDLSIHMTPKRIRMNFENLFNGNKLLGDNINKVLNEEWEALFKDVKPSIEKSYSDIFKNYAQSFFDKVPVDKIFLKE